MAEAIIAAATAPMRIAPIKTAGTNQRGGLFGLRFIVNSQPGHEGNCPHGSEGFPPVGGCGVTPPAALLVRAISETDAAWESRLGKN